jgi:hypothetical protein
MTREEVDACVASNSKGRCPGCSSTLCIYSPEYDVECDDRDADVHPIVVVQDI